MQLGSNYVLDRDNSCPQSPGWSHSKTGGLHILKCKSRKCEYCGKFWAYKWRQALAEKELYDEKMNIPKARTALTLTLAENVNFLVLQRVLEYFWRFVRLDYPTISYWGTVECDQEHKRPHIHFILGNVSFIPYQELRKHWVKAQQWAKVGKTAWILRIEEVQKNMQAYFTKYVTKLLGGKDEIPRREQWQGRYIRYSRNFFPASVPAMAVYASWVKQWELQRFNWPARSYSTYKDKACEAGLTHFINLAKIADQELLETLTRPWLHQDDKLLGVKVTLDIFDIADYNKCKMPLHERHLVPLTYPL